MLKPHPITHGRRLAFTLIELLIVVAIIAILAAIAVPNFLEAQTRAKVSRARADMRTEATALETYHIDHNKYPRPFDAFFGGTYYTRGNWHEHVPSTLTTPLSYLSTIPIDPFKPRTPDWRDLKYVEGRHFYYNNDFSLKAIFEDRGIKNYSHYVAFEKAVGKYALFSYGPDRIYYNNPPGVDPNALGQFINYDATNGTLSRGNIVRGQKGPELAGQIELGSGYWNP